MTLRYAVDLMYLRIPESSRLNLQIQYLDLMFNTHRRTHTIKHTETQQPTSTRILYFLPGYVVLVSVGTGDLPDGPSCSDVAVAAVIWRFRWTSRQGNYFGSCSYGFGFMVTDVQKWRPRFHKELRYKYKEHRGLAWGPI